MQIHWRNPEAVDLQERRKTEDTLRALAGAHNDLIDVWVELGPPSRHRRGNRSAKLRAQVRLAELVASGQGEDVALALRDALVTFTRELRDLRDRRADRKPDLGSTPPLRGVVDRVFQGEDYGFLISDSGERVYFHRNALGGGLDFAALREGQSVAFDFEAGEKGAQATVVLPPT